MGALLQSLFFQWLWHLAGTTRGKKVAYNHHDGRSPSVYDAHVGGKYDDYRYGKGYDDASSYGYDHQGFAVNPFHNHLHNSKGGNYYKVSNYYGNGRPSYKGYVGAEYDPHTGRRGSHHYRSAPWGPSYGTKARVGWNDYNPKETYRGGSHEQHNDIAHEPHDEKLDDHSEHTDEAETDSGAHSKSDSIAAEKLKLKL